MSTLANFPMVSQLTTVTGDGRPSENSQLDCVAASIDAVCRHILNTPENSVFNPDHLKDVAYGEAYIGGTDASHYVAFCATLGIHLYAIDAADTAHAVSLAHRYIQKGIPVIFTEIDPYVDTNLAKYAGWTHVGVWFSEDDAGLTALDPWLGKPLYKIDATWASLLRSNQIWIAERIQPMGIPANWHNDGTTLWSPNNTQGMAPIPITGPFRDYILANNWPSSNVALGPAYHTPQLEASDTALGAGQQMVFRYAMLGIPDAGTGAGKMIFEWLGSELSYTRKQLEAAQSQIVTLQQQLQAVPQGIDPAKVANRLQSIELLLKQGEQLATSPF